MSTISIFSSSRTAQPLLTTAALGYNKLTMKKLINLKLAISLLAIILLILLVDFSGQAARKNKTWGTQFSSNSSSERKEIYIGRDEPYDNLRMQVITPAQEEETKGQDPIIIEPHIKFNASDFLKNTE